MYFVILSPANGGTKNLSTCLRINSRIRERSFVAIAPQDDSLFMYQPDFYSKKAKAEGYPARSIYKLREIDQKYRLFKKGGRILDLGCSPGSWLLELSEKAGEKGQVIGVDIEEIKISLRKNIRFIKKDAMELKKNDLGPEKFEAVVSDMAPSTSGVKFADAEESLDLAKQALAVAEKFLKPGGVFLCKVFESEAVNDFFRKVQKRFKFAKRFRPKAVKKASREMYIIAKGFTPYQKNKL